MQKLTHQQKEIVNKSDVIVLINYSDNLGFPRFCFFSCKPANLAKLNDAVVKKGSGKWKDYGVVIKKGFGEPSEQVWAEMKKDYGLEKDKLTVFTK